MALREADHGRSISRATTRPYLPLWCEKEFTAMVICIAGLLICPSGFQIKYVIVGAIWIVVGLAIGQHIARLDPRALAKLRAHRRWKAKGSAVLPYFIDERSLVEQVATFVGISDWRALKTRWRRRFGLVRR